MESRLSDYINNPNEVLGIGQPIPVFATGQSLPNDVLSNFVLSGRIYLQSEYQELFQRLGLLGVSDTFSVNSRITQDINASAFGDSYYVLAGNSGSLAASTDAVLWTEINPTTTLNVTSLIENNAGTWIRGLSNGNIQTLATNQMLIGGSWAARTSNLSTPVTALLFNSVSPVFYVAGDSAGQISTTTTFITAFGRNSVDDPVTNIRQIAFGSGVYVKAYRTSVLRTSTDLQNWSPVSLTSTNGVAVVAYNSSAEKFVSISADTSIGSYRTSTDGVTWSEDQVLTQSSVFTSITVANDNFVITGTNGLLHASSDGDNWWSLGIADNYGINNATYPGLSLTINNSLYALATSVGTIKTSTDLKKWDIRRTPSGTTTPESTNFKFVNDLYFATFAQNGPFFVSNDLSTWTDRTFTTLLVADVTFGTGVYVAVGASGRAYTSTDAVTWTSNSTASTDNLSTVIFEQNQFVAVGSSGRIQTSTNAVTWTIRTSGTSSNLSSIIFKNNLYVTVGRGGALQTSTNGVTWAARTSNTTSAITRVEFGNNIYLYVGAGGVTGTSTNAITWTARTSGATGLSTDFLASLTFDTANSRFIVGDLSGRLRTTTDGLSWTVLSDRHFLNMSGATGNNYHINYGNDRYVYISRRGPGQLDRRISTNLVDWTEAWEQILNITDTPQSINFLNGNFIIAAANRRLLISQSGRVWQSIQLPADLGLGSVTLNDTAYYDGKYYVVGNSGTLIETSDFLNWTVISIPTTENLNGILITDDKIVAYGGMVTAEKAFTSNTWEVIPELRTQVNKMIYVQGTYVAACNGGIIRTATQPNSTWTYLNKTFTGTSSNITSIAHNGVDVYVISVNNGTTSCIATSTNLTNWEYKDLGEIATVNSLIYDGSNFIAASNKGVFLSDNNGTTWVKKVSDTIGGNFLTSTYAGEKYIFAGSNGIAEITDNWNNKYTIGYDVNTEFYVPLIEDINQPAAADQQVTQVGVYYYVRAK